MKIAFDIDDTMIIPMKQRDMATMAKSSITPMKTLTELDN